MSLLCNTCRSCNNCNNSTVSASTQQTVLMNAVIDSCCTTEEVTREITVPCGNIFDCQELEIGSVLPVEVDGDITFKQISNDMSECLCMSSARFMIPIRILSTDECGCMSSSLCRVINVVRTANLCCTKDSVLTASVYRVLAISAIVSDIQCNNITITVSFLFQTCLLQTALREFVITATPVCSHTECSANRNFLVDPCDLLCCNTTGVKTCQQCE